MLNFVTEKFFGLAMAASNRCFLDIWAYEPKKPACLMKKNHKA